MQPIDRVSQKKYNPMSTMSSRTVETFSHRPSIHGPSIHRPSIVHLSPDYLPTTNMLFAGSSKQMLGSPKIFKQIFCSKVDILKSKQCTKEGCFKKIDEQNHLIKKLLHDTSKNLRVINQLTEENKQLRLQSNACMSRIEGIQEKNFSLLDKLQKCVNFIRSEDINLETHSLKDRFNLFIHEELKQVTDEDIRWRREITEEITHLQKTNAFLEEENKHIKRMLGNCNTLTLRTHFLNNEVQIPLEKPILVSMPSSGSTPDGPALRISANGSSEIGNSNLFQEGDQNQPPLLQPQD